MQRRYLFAIGSSIIFASVLAVNAQEEARKDDPPGQTPAADVPARERPEAAGRDGGRGEAGRPEAAGREAARGEGDAAAAGHRREAAPDRGRSKPRAADEGARRGGVSEAELRNQREMADRQYVRAVEAENRARAMMEGRGTMERMKQDDPEMFELAKADAEMDNQTRQLVDQYQRAANDGDREQLRGKLVAVVENHFAVRQARRELEIKRLEQQLDRLRAAVKKRSDERQKIIEQHVSQVLGSDDSAF